MTWFCPIVRQRQNAKVGVSLKRGRDWAPRGSKWHLLNLIFGDFLERGIIQLSEERRPPAIPPKNDAGRAGDAAGRAGDDAALTTEDAAISPENDARRDAALWV